MTALLFILMAMLGTIVQTVSGFGFAIIAMMVFPLLTGDVAAAAAISGLFALTNAVFNTFKYRQEIDWKFVFLPLIGYAILSTISLEIIGAISNEGMMRFLGIAMVLLGIYFMFFQSKMTINPTKVNALIAGGLSGVLGSLFAIAGPPIALFYTMLIENNKFKYLGCINAYFLISNAYVSILRFHTGILGLEELHCWGLGLLGLILGRIIGGLLLNKVDGKLIKKLVYCVTIFSGICYLI